MNRTLDVCFTPALLHLYDIEDKIVVVIDIFRASSTICTALHHGAMKVIPVSSMEDAKIYLKNGHIVGAERNGKIPTGFKLGNSPFHYMNGEVQNKTVVLTTTNGTRAIEDSKLAKKIVIGSFLNLSALCTWLQRQNENVLLFCAGWKDRFNLEDTLFAGAVVNQLKDHFDINYDASLAAEGLYNCNKNDLLKILKNASHYKRLESLGVDQDIEYCIQHDKMDVIPVMEGEGLVVHS